MFLCCLKLIFCFLKLVLSTVEPCTKIPMFFRLLDVSLGLSTRLYLHLAQLLGQGHLGHVCGRQLLPDVFCVPVGVAGPVEVLRAGQRPEVGAQAVRFGGRGEDLEGQTLDFSLFLNEILPENETAAWLLNTP